MSFDNSIFMLSSEYSCFHQGHENCLHSRVLKAKQTPFSMYQYLIFINPSNSNANYLKIIKRSGCDASDRFFLKNSNPVCTKMKAFIPNLKSLILPILKQIKTKYLT